MAQPTMLYDPANGRIEPYPSEPKAYREFHGQVAWLFNPWNGSVRDARDVGSDPFGHGIRAEPHKPVFQKGVHHHSVSVGRVAGDDHFQANRESQSDYLGR